MRPLALIAAILASLAPTIAWAASQAEARDAAREANCTPNKVEVVRYVPGTGGETIFKVGCNENKDAFILVRCRGRTCSVVR